MNRPHTTSIAGRIRSMKVGDVEFFDHHPHTVRPVITRVKAETGRIYTSKPDGDGVLVWRLPHPKKRNDEHAEEKIASDGA